METEVKVLGVRMPVDLLRQVEEAAKREDRTMSNWVRTQIRHGLAEEQKSTRREQKTDN